MTMEWIGEQGLCLVCVCADEAVAGACHAVGVPEREGCVDVPGRHVEGGELGSCAGECHALPCTYAVRRGIWQELIVPRTALKLFSMYCSLWRAE